MKTLSDWLKLAQSEDWALPHFNISTADQLRAIVEVCDELKSPVIIGVSEGEVDYLGYAQTVALIESWRKQAGIPIFLNADHHKSLERAKMAIDAGFDSVNIDLSLLPDNDNIAESKAVVEYARRQKRYIDIEGEIGALPTQSSEVLDHEVEIDESTLTRPEQARDYVQKTGVDRLTPAVGTLHGIVASGKNPKLNVVRLREIADVVSLPLTLHGGSGLTEDEFKLAAKYMSNIHINTDLRVAYTQGIRSKINDTTTPYKYLKSGYEAMKKVVEEKVKLFGSDNKA